MYPILVATPCPVQRRVLGYSLAQAGYDVLSVPDCAQAFEALVAHPIELALVDLGADPTVASALLHELHLAEIPAVALIGSAHRHHHVVALELGATLTLGTPCTTRELLAVLDQILAPAAHAAPIPFPVHLHDVVLQERERAA